MNQKRSLASKTTWSLALAFALTAGACGQGESTEATAAAEGVESFDDLEWESPIADFLGVDTGFDFNSEEAQAEYAEESAAAEEQIAECMAAEGFEYIPVDHGQYDVFAGTSEELPYFSDEWIAKFGFGITTQWFAQSEVGPDLIGYDDSQFEEQTDEFVDPNQEYVESLPEAEREAYYEVLYGSEPELPVDATEADYEAAYENWEPDGCANDAWMQIGQGGGGEYEFYEEFGDELDALYERIEADPRVTEHNNAVSACVAEQGLEYTNMQTLYERFDSEIMALDPYGSPADDPYADVDFDSMTDEELEIFFENQPVFELSDEAKERLGELQEEELALARVIVDCGGGPLNDEVLLGTIRVEYEQEFIDSNRDLLADYEGASGDS